MPEGRSGRVEFTRLVAVPFLSGKEHQGRVSGPENSLPHGSWWKMPNSL
jgi:hypothetical protein